LMSHDDVKFWSNNNIDILYGKIKKTGITLSSHYDFI